MRLKNICVTNQINIMVKMLQYGLKNKNMAWKYPQKKCRTRNALYRVTNLF